MLQDGGDKRRNERGGPGQSEREKTSLIAGAVFETRHTLKPLRLVGYEVALNLDLSRSLCLRNAGLIPLRSSSLLPVDAFLTFYPIFLGRRRHLLTNHGTGTQGFDLRRV